MKSKVKAFSYGPANIMWHAVHDVYTEFHDTSSHWSRTHMGRYEMAKVYFLTIRQQDAKHDLHVIHADKGKQ
jgi:hypothetical protein